MKKTSPSDFYANSSLANNPASSWGYKPDNPINSSGDTFAVRELGPYISVNKVETFLNVANFMTSFFHIDDGRSRLLGRYMNNQISHYKASEIDNRHYIGLVMKSPNGKRECNVIMIDAVDELLRKLQSVDALNHLPIATLGARLKSTQDYDFKLEMLACFHGVLEHSAACSRLRNSGDFLVRSSPNQPGVFVATYKIGPNQFEKAIFPENNINIFKQFQVRNCVLKRPIVRPDF
ncbi:Protein CBG07382 [Caenorhabditis briggsae]|uniref:Protein CBG07382 n=1 Tax=Caenorhabditis briggsae TaxID=6238 RepID=A8X4W3_CAEBR|nr:Protein CBG07382 [Caenorhabditis briggsae]CAP27673.2 Protein CBG07382 [Caenorhabditis briggsae]